MRILRKKAAPSVLVTAVLTSLIAGAARADTFVSDSSEQGLWLACTRSDPSRGEEIVFALLDERRDFVLPRRIQPQTGKIQWMTVRGTRLHVIYDDGVHMGYSEATGDAPEKWLVDRYVPAALTADAAGEYLYAVVETWLAAKIQRTASEPVTAPASAPTRPATTRAAASRYSLVRYDRGRWNILAEIPDQLLPESPRFFLGALDKAVHAFSVSGDGGPIHHAVYADGRWVNKGSFDTAGKGRPFRLLRVGQGAQAQLVLVLTESAEDTRRIRVRLVRVISGRWAATEPLAENGRQLVFAPNDFAVAAWKDRIALFHRQADGGVLWALLSPDGRMAEGFASIPVFEPLPEPALSPDLRSWLTPIVLMAIMAVVYWRWRDGLVDPVVLPANARLAPLWWRGLGLAVDLVPAVLLTLPLWWPEAKAEKVLWERLIADPTTISANLYRVSWVVRVVYVAYCGAMEAALGQTAGKMIGRCRVSSQTGERPTLRQVGIRNLLRLLELDPLLSIWWVAILVLLTRNHQRLGDILAGTVVIQMDSGSGAGGEGTLGEG